MQRDDPVDGAPFGWPDQPLMGDAYRVQRAVEALWPEFQDTAQFGKFRRQVIVLPDVELEKGGVVRHVVVDLRRGEPVALQLPAEAAADECSHMNPLECVLPAPSMMAHPAPNSSA